MSDPIAPLSAAAQIDKIQLEIAKSPQILSDTIAPAKSNPTAYIPSKPTLMPPHQKSKSDKFYMYRMLDFINDADQIEKDLMQIASDGQEDLVKQLSQLAKEELEKARLAEDAGQSASNWAYLNNIATCLFAGATMAIGLYLTGNPDVSGWVSYGMVAAGAGSITAMTLSELDIWPDLMRIMGLGTGMLGLVLGGGSSFAFVAAHLPDLMAQITMLGINCIYGMSTVGRSYRKSQMQWYTHEQFKARGARRKIEGKSAEHAQSLEFTIDRIEYLNERAFRMLEEQDKQNRQIQRIAAPAA